MFDAAANFDPPDCAAGTPARPEALQQSDLWLSALTQLGRDATRDRVGNQSPVVLRTRLPVIGQIALLSRANLVLSQGAAADLRRDFGVRHLVVNPETLETALSLARAGFTRIAHPRMIALLDLSSDPDPMAARLRPKWRNRLRHGQTQGLILRRRPLPPDANHWLLRTEDAQARRLRYRPLPPQLIAAMAAAHPGAAQCFTAYNAGVAVAAMLFLRHGRTATYQIGWSDPEGRRLSAGPALMWRAMVELQATGIDHIDLGAADPHTAPGLCRFKLGTGARQHSLGGTWIDSRWLPRRPAYSLARRMADLDSETTQAARTESRLNPPKPTRAAAARAPAGPPGFPAR